MSINFDDKKDVLDHEILKESKEYTDKKSATIQYIISAILVIVFLSFIQIVIDSFRFSSVTYREYSEKIKSIKIIQKNNEELLRQNKANQEIIIELQNQLLSR